MNTKKLLSVLLAVVLLLMLAACGEAGVEETTAPAESVTATEPSSASGQVPAKDDSRILYFSLSMGESYESIKSLTAYENEDGSIRVEYVGEEKKVGNMDPAILGDLAAALEESGLLKLDGQSEYAEGDASGSLFISYADESFAAADFSGFIPQEFVEGYEVMDAWFRSLTADMPLYVPQALVMGQVDAQTLEAVQGILNASGMEGQDGLTISDIPMDEYFTFTAGLTTGDGIVNGTICAPMMNVTPYSLVIVTMEREGDAKAVRADFEDSLDWGKWVCVAPSNALIAQKGNMILCLMGSGDMFAQTSDGIKACGWTEIETFDNPSF